MKKLFGFALLALAFLAPDLAQAANRFLTCTTACTITAADTSIWGTASGGTGASVPGSGDAVILDGNTCVGGTTCTATMGAAYNPTWQSFDMSACTASTSGCIFDANTNTNSITLTNGSAFTNTGAGTRTLSGGTWTLSSNTAVWNNNSSSTITNSPSVFFTGATPAVRQFVGGGKTYGTVTVAAGTTGIWSVTNSNTIGTLTISAPNKIVLASGSTTTITTFTNITATNSAPLLFNMSGGVTVSSANNFTCTWCGIVFMTFTGGGTFTGTNSLDFGNNSGITITPPSGGGSSGKIIGG